MKPLRVLHVVGGMNRAGIETWLMHVTRAVGRSDFAFDFLLHEPRETAYEPELRELGCGIARVPAGKRSPAYARALERCFANGRWDIVHSHEHHTTGLILRAAARAGVRIRVAHSHNDTRLADARACLVRKTFNRVNRIWTWRHAHAGLAASEPAAAALFGQSWRDDPRWRVLACGIDPGPFRRPVNSAAIRRGLGFPAGAFVIGHVGRFERQKNHAFFIEVARELSSRSPAFHFLLVGEGSLQADVCARIETAGLSHRFTVLRDRSDVPELMLGAMDVFLFPSLHEGLGLAAVEAQAAALPCIMSSSVPAEADLFPAANARLALTRSAGEWADAVVAALGRGRHADIAGRLAAIENSGFCVSRSAAALLSAYRELAA